MHHPAHILVIDDDSRLRALLQQYLSGEGYAVSGCETAAEAQQFLTLLTPDLLVLDVMMPGQSGLEFAQSLPPGAPPVLMLTAKADGPDRIQGLEAGVADYLTKPFEPRELLLRIENILKRRPAEAESPPSLPLGALYYDRRSQQLRGADDRPIGLTAAEITLLEALAEADQRPVSRNVLAQALGLGEDQLRNVDVQIGRLRKKLGDSASAIRTLRGQGYALVPGSVAESVTGVS